MIQLRNSRVLSLKFTELRSVPEALPATALNGETERRMAHLMIEQRVEPLLAIRCVKFASHNDPVLFDVAGGEGAFLRSGAPVDRIVQ